MSDLSRVNHAQRNLNLENSIREIDYKMLETLLLKERVMTYNKALDIINNGWAKQLGF